MHSLFTYGTIAQDDIQMRILGHLCEKKPAVLEGYKVCRGKWSYLMSDKGSIAKGWVIENLTDEDISKLDDYEKINSIPLDDKVIYARRLTDVLLENKSTASCWVYFPILEKWRPEWL